MRPRTIRMFVKALAGRAGKYAAGGERSLAESGVSGKGPRIDWGSAHVQQCAVGPVW
jgi:hypothetical protein